MVGYMHTAEVGYLGCSAGASLDDEAHFSYLKLMKVSHFMSFSVVY